MELKGVKLSDWDPWTMAEKKKRELQNDTQTKNEKLKNAHVLHGQWNLIALALNESASRKMVLWDTHSISS